MQRNIYIGRALGVVAAYCEQLGYEDAWLLDIAGEAARARNWELAREAIATFVNGRSFGPVEGRALDYLTRLVWDCLVWDAELKIDYEEELVEELVEEKPL
jgi:hypothetical protein